MNTKIIELDINERINEKITAKQGDAKSRFLLFHLLDDNKHLDLTGKSVRCFIKKPDKMDIFNDLVINDAKRGYCTLELTSQALAVYGTANMELMVSKSDKKLTSIPFTIDIIKCINNEDSIVSTNEFSALMNGLSKIEAWDKEFTDKSGKLEELYTPKLNELSAQMDNKANKSDVGSPLTASGIAEMIDKTRVYVNTTDGKWYSWNGTAWAIGGVYNSQGISKDSVNITDTTFYTKTNVTNIEMELGSINALNGTLIETSSFMRSKYYIPVEELDNILFNENKGYAFRVIFFDSSNKYISYLSDITTNSLIKIPPNCIRIKFTTYKVNNDNDLTNTVFITTININSSLINKEYIKDASEISQMIDDIVDETTIVKYSNKFIYYNPKDFSLNVIGENAQDTRIVVFKSNNELYTIKGIDGDKKILISNTGNAWIVINKNTVDKNNVTINDMSIVTTVLANHIKIAHLVWNSAVNSKIIKRYEEKEISQTVASKTTGEDINFMKGMMSQSKQIFKIAYWGDSIFGSGFKDTGLTGDRLYELAPRVGNLNGIQKMTFDYINNNKPIFRNVLHSNWSFTGATKNSLSMVMPNGNVGGVGDCKEWEMLKMLNDTINENTAQITVTGEDTIAFMFEGGMKNNSVQTGIVNILVKVDNGNFVNPSTILKGKLTKKGYGDNKVYESAKDNFDTSFTQYKTVNDYNKYTAMNELIYSGLDKSKAYTFKIIKANSEKDVRLWGCYYFSGQTVLVINQSKPGLSWNALSSHINTDLVIPEVDYVILEAPMYHDWILNTARDNCKNLINKVKSKGIQIALCSCPPGGVVPIGRATAILGDENGSSYWSEQHFYRYYNRFRRFYTTSLNDGNKPTRHDIYSTIISGVTYNMEVVGLNGLTQTYFNCTTNNFPKKLSGVFPLTFTKVNGASSSSSSIVYTNMEEHFDMEEHRASMLEMSNELNIKFIDIFQVFVDLAKSVGETLDSDAYDMDSNHPFYTLCEQALLKPNEYPTLKKPFKMNYMTNFFDLGDGHHLHFNAHEPIFELIKNEVLRNCVFKK